MQTLEASPARKIISDTEPDLAPFRISSIATAYCNLSAYNRRDYFKITFILKSDSTLVYAKRGIEINRPALVFTNPMVPYSWDGDHANAIGYFCVFTNKFLQENMRMNSLDESNLFKAGGDPVYFLNDEQAAYVQSIYTRLQQEMDSDYVHKYEVIRNNVNLLIHEAIKMQPASEFFIPKKASSRISKLFTDLLEKQFPVDSPQYILTLKKASDYADKLAMHVNHLNAAVQEATGKSTTAHINHRILSEARSLLLHTDWSVADIARSLGFEYASYFNNFFRKHTGITPLSVRKIS